MVVPVSHFDSCLACATASIECLAACVIPFVDDHLCLDDQWYRRRAHCIPIAGLGHVSSVMERCVDAAQSAAHFRKLGQSSEPLVDIVTRSIARSYRPLDPEATGKHLGISGKCCISALPSPQDNSVVGSLGNAARAIQQL